jgi:hypothetical protein
VGIFVTDIFREVDEEVRRDQLQKLWERYQNYVVAGIVVIVLGVGGWRGYEWWEIKKASESGSSFEAAMTLAEEGKHAEAETTFAKLATDGTKSYRNLARVRQAAELALRDPKTGIAAYERIAADSSVEPALADLAALRAGVLLIDAGSFDEARARLQPLTGDGRPYRHSGRELLALAAWRSGDTTAARRWFDIIVTDFETPAATRNRIEMLIALSTAENKG